MLFGNFLSVNNVDSVAQTVEVGTKVATVERVDGLAGGFASNLDTAYAGSCILHIEHGRR